MTRTARRPAVAGLLLMVLAVLAGCSSGGSHTDPAAVLSQARQSLSSAKTLHFTLSSEGLPATGTVLVRGEGDAARPDKLSGTFTVRASGFTADVGAVATGGTLYAKLPLAAGFTRTDPARLGIGDPGALFSSGVDRLLAAAMNPTDAGRDRLSGELLDEVAVTLPGQVVGDVLRIADPAQPVRGRIGVTADEPHQVRRVELTGRFYEGTDTTYTIVLTDYGKPVEIRAPAG